MQNRNSVPFIRLFNNPVHNKEEEEVVSDDQRCYVLQVLEG